MLTPFANHWFLTGPTASGKTAVGIELARTMDAEIVSMDSMALYRRMNVGTAKPTDAERAAVRHHLIDVVEPYEDFSLAEYLQQAETVCSEIVSRGKQVLFVGGTPLYLKALLRGVFSGPPADWDLRRQWQAVAQQEGNDALHRELAKVDPLTAKRLHAHDTRRIIRALEVFAKTGQSIAQLQQQFDRARSADQCHVYVLDWPRDQLVDRIHQRVDAMFAAGWLDEVRTLIADEPPFSRTAFQAVGYREIVGHLHGDRNLSETVELVKTHTRQFAKRQLTWFRSLTECRWLPIDATHSPPEIARQIASQL